jgi:hypothetical protein
VTKGDKAIFRDASPADTSMAAPEKIRANIAYLHLRLLGEPADDAAVDTFYTGVFLPAEPRGGPSRGPKSAPPSCVIIAS